MPIKVFEVLKVSDGSLRVDDYELKWDPAQSLAEVCPVSHGINVCLRALADPGMPRFEELVDYPEEGLGFRLTFQGVCQQAVPTASFEFENGRCQDSRTYLWDDGWAYSLEFTGTVVLERGWLSLHGRMGKEWGPDFEGPLISASYPLRAEQFDWSHYRFASIDETIGVDPSNVRYLELLDLSSSTLPEQLLEFVQLRELWLTQSGGYGVERSHLPLESLPDGFETLEHLERLLVSGVSLSQLPKSLSRLPKLRYLSVTHSKLESLGPEALCFPQLKILNLDQNRLSHWPSKGELPELELLTLSHNQLTTLPCWLARQPKLRKLNLEQNPWQELDGAFLELPELELEFEHKRRLFDYNYRSADGVRPADWDREAHYLRSDQVAFSELTQSVEKLGYDGLKAPLAMVTKKTLYLAHGAPDDYAELGNTRFGGWPDLPAGVPYPRYKYQETTYAYQFIGQLNCRELAPWQSYLPRSGMLFFFLDNPEDCGGLVLYFPEDAAQLVSGRSIQMRPDEMWDYHEGPYQPYRALPQVAWSLPPDYSAPCNPHYFPPGSESLLEGDLSSELSDQLLPFKPGVHHESNGYVFTQNEGPELQAALRRRGNPEDWTVLLKVSSIGDFQWWDAGDLFFVVHQGDLAQKDFRNVYCGLESS